MATKPPTTEIGYVTQYGDDKNPGDLINWASILDERETNRELAFPMSVTTYRKMRSTDAVITAILNAITMPIRRFSWMVDPNGARDEVVEMVARNFNLPVKGALDEPIKRSMNKFNHDLHLKQVLRGMLTFGFHYNEQVGEIVNGQFRYRKLAPRPQHSITKIRVASDGGLMGIQQGYGVDAPSVPVERLIAYIYNQEPGSWVGESMLRAMYRPWKIKDRILRVGAINIERAGGIPWIEAGKDANRGEILKAKEFAQQFRVGETSGGALPYGWQLKFAQAAGGSEAAEYVKLQNQEMATAALAMFLNLGTTETGSRALGEGFIDFFSLQLDTIAGEYAATENAHGVEDLVTWNYGEEEQSPRIIYDRNPNPKLAVAELVSLISAGAIVVDNDLEDELRGEYGIVPAVRLEAAPVQAPAFGYDLDNPILKIDDRRAQLGLEPREDGLGSLTVPEFMAVLDQQTKGAAGAMPEESAATAALGSDFVAAAKERQSITFRAVAETVYAAKDPEGRVKLPTNRELHRQPKDFEVAAALNLEAIEDAWNAVLDVLLAAWKTLRGQQITAIGDQIRKATSITDFSLIDLDAAGTTTVLEDAMIEMVAEGIEQAIAEAKAQGVTIPEPDIDKLADEIEERAGVISQMIADNLVNAAKRKATDVSADDFDPDTIADIVEEHLNELKDGWLEQQLQGALANAMATGRHAAQEKGDKGAEVYYPSSILDANTCSDCAANDGREYATLKEALRDYPVGPYIKCKGGKWCRCFIVAKYKEGYTVDPAVAAARKPNAPNVGNRKIQRNNAGQFGTKDIRLKGMQDRIKANKTGSNRAKFELSAEDKIKNFRTMHGKDPSPEQMRKLGIAPKDNGVKTPKKDGLASKVVKLIGDVLARNTKAKADIENIFGRKLDADEQAIIDKMFETAKPKPPKPDPKPKGEAKPKGEGGGSSGGGKAKGSGGGKKSEGGTKTPQTDEEKATAATAALEDALGRPLSYDERTLVEEMAKVAPGTTQGEKSQENGGEGNQGGDSGKGSQGERESGGSSGGSQGEEESEGDSSDEEESSGVVKPTESPTARKKRAVAFIDQRLHELQFAGLMLQREEGYDPYSDMASMIRAQRMSLGDLQKRIKRLSAGQDIDAFIAEEMEGGQRQEAHGVEIGNKYSINAGRAAQIEGRRLLDELSSHDVTAPRKSSKPDRVETPTPEVTEGGGIVSNAKPRTRGRKGKLAKPQWPTKNQEKVQAKGIANIQSVHNPDVALVIIGGGASKSASGSYGAWAVPPADPTIKLDPKAGNVETFVHEAGHAIDQQMFGRRATKEDHAAVAYMSENRTFEYLDKNCFGSGMAETDENHPLRGWWEAAVPAFRDSFDERADNASGFSQHFKKNKHYYNRNHEIFARSYEQYIAHRSGDTESQERYYGNEAWENGERRTVERVDEDGRKFIDINYESKAVPPRAALPWTREEFEPIAAEFDKLFGVTP